MIKTLAAGVLSIALASNIANAESFEVEGSSGTTIVATTIAEFNSPWAMTFVDQDRLLITTKPGEMWMVNTDGTRTAVTGVPKPSVGGQGGLGDVVLHPDFATNRLVYLTYVEANPTGSVRGSVVDRATLDLTGKPALKSRQRIWTQIPKQSRGGHFSQRLAFGPHGTEHADKLFITSGDRQAKTPAQKWNMALGKIIRLNDDGTVPPDNPFQDKGELAKTFWTLGHRNSLGIAFDKDNRLWAIEMGPRHGDELNLIVRGENYGWPEVSNGDQYSGLEIPDHDTRPEFAAPKAWWTPSIAPAGLIIYSGTLFADWKGDALIGGLLSRALVRVDLEGDTAREAERFEWGKRIREVEQGPDGAIWVLEDRDGGRLLKLTPS